MKTICVFNQKGGVGKTTTVVNLAAALGKLGKKVLVVDMDPQGNSTSGLGIDKSSLEHTTYELLLQHDLPEQVIQKSSADMVDIIPANSQLAGIEVEMIQMEDRERILRNRLSLLTVQYDYILIDCPPSLGFLSLNALTSADSVLIPIQCEYYALEGVSQLVETINLVKKGLNKSLQIEGIVLSMFDGRNNLSIEVVEEVKKYFKNKVLRSIIPRSVRLAEAPSYGRSVLDYDDKSKGALAYQALANEIVQHNEG